MLDLKVIKSVLEQLEQERGIPKEKIIDAIEVALATAYKKEYGKRGQIVRAHFDLDSGTTEFEQIKLVVDASRVRIPEERGQGNPDEEEREEKTTDDADSETLVNFNPEHHILLEDARKMKKDANLDDELVFPLDSQENYGRIAAQTAKQVIIQKIREAEKVSVLDEFSNKEGEIVSGTVQRIERGTLFIDLGRTTGIIPPEEQLPTERYRQGERVRAYLFAVEETPRGVFLRLSRSHPQFLLKLFEVETPEIAQGVVVIKAIAREAGSRSKVAVTSLDEHIDPVGSLVGQRGVRVSTVMSELSGEKIDVIEWSHEPVKFVEDALSPAKALKVDLDETLKKATVEVAPDQQSLAIGKGGQNVRLAAKLTGWKIDIRSLQPNAPPVEEAREDVTTNTDEIETTDDNTETPMSKQK